MNKSELIDWLRQEIHQWESLLKQVGPQRMEQPGADGDWSMKDLAAHLTTWNRRLVSYIQAAKQGEPWPPPPWPAHLEAEEDINAWIYETNRSRTAEDILAETHRVLHELLAVIESLPDDVKIETEWRLVWLNDKRYPAGEFFDHLHSDHEAAVRGWLAHKSQA